MRWETVTSNHAQSILVVKNLESQSQKVFIRKTFLCSRDFITEQKKTRQHRIVFVIDGKYIGRNKSIPVQIFESND